MKNRRNYYRILHIQPDAPLEIIKASYRGLMLTLKAHPDLGGDHEAAVLINEAYAVLSDPEQRARYDRGSHSSPQRLRATASPAMYVQPLRAGPYESREICLFCDTSTGLLAGAPHRCRCCASPMPLARRAAGRGQQEVFGRRAAPRIAKTGGLMVYPHWPHEGYRAQLQNLSRSGICLASEFAPRVNQIIKIDSPLLAAVARVTLVRGAGGRYVIHGSLVAAEFTSQKGGFFSVKV